MSDNDDSDVEAPDYISPETRREVMVRDEWRCRSCGEMDLSKLTLHHIQYRSQRGSHEADNLVTLCLWPCHRAIHDKKMTVARIGDHFFFGRVGTWRTKL